MQITQEADYAVRIVYCLAQRAQRTDAKTISEEVAVTPRFALKILHKLSCAGLVKSFKGARGGYELARPAAEITMRDVIETVEGPTAVTRCIKTDGECNRTDHMHCPFKCVFESITNQINNQLEAVNFAALVAGEVK